MPTADAVAAYVSALEEAATRARSNTGTESMTASLAGLGVELMVSGARLAETVFPALRHLPAATTSQLRVHIWDGSAGDLPPPPWDESAVVARGVISGLGDSTSAAVTTSTFSLLDRASDQAFFWTPDAASLPWWERAAPLRTILSWWLEDHGRYFAHAACVATEGRAVLLAGPGGSGKSTTSVACLVAGLDFLGGDYVILKPGSPPDVYSVYSSAKLDDRSLRLLPSLQPLVADPAQRDGEKSVIYLHRHFDRSRLAEVAEIRAILLPRIAHTTSVEPTTSAMALRILAPSSIFQLPGPGGEAFKAISRVVREVPSSHLGVGPDPAEAVQRISALIDGA